MVTAALTAAVGIYANEAEDLQHIPLHNLRGAQRLWADRLLSVFKGLPIDGVEWSMKFSAAGLVGNRFTLGIQRAHWAALNLASVAQWLAIPPSLWLQIQQDMQLARAILFSFEPGGDGDDTYRIYLELMPTSEALRQHGVLPLGRGYKWHPSSGREAVVTDYRMRYLESPQAFASYLAPYLESLTNLVIRQVADRVIERAAALTDPSQFMFLEANEADTRRDSFSVTFRGADLPVRSFIPDLLRLASSLALNESEVLGFLLPNEPRSLYSLAAGTARDGHEFLTVYYD